MAKIEQQIRGMLRQFPFTLIEQNTYFWKRGFGTVAYSTPSFIAIPVIPKITRENRLFRLSKGIESLASQKRHKEVKLDIVEKCVKNKDLRPLFEHFESVKQLFGVTLVSSVGGVRLVYEGLVTLDFKPFERITVSDKDILNEVEEEKIARVIHGVILPLNSGFSNTFFKELRDIM